MSFNKTIIILTMCTIIYAHPVMSGENNMIKLVFALQITDEKKYLEYRNKIKPLMNELNVVVLKEYRISKVVHSNSVEERVNMLAMFGFPSQKIKESFFSSVVYQEALLLFSESTTNFSKHVEE
ncbi:MAG: DUF1330 domain-containing protein [Proteobacteria bacterium]|nr:DUF1330 domain-containing protein [Pseudomonadota bacterium]